MSDILPRDLTQPIKYWMQYNYNDFQNVFQRIIFAVQYYEAPCHSETVKPVRKFHHHRTSIDTITMSEQVRERNYKYNKHQSAVAIIGLQTG